MISTKLEIRVEGKSVTYRELTVSGKAIRNVNKYNSNDKLKMFFVEGMVRTLDEVTNHKDKDGNPIVLPINSIKIYVETNDILGAELKNYSTTIQGGSTFSYCKNLMTFYSSLVDEFLDTWKRV